MQSSRRWSGPGTSGTSSTTRSTRNARGLARPGAIGLVAGAAVDCLSGADSLVGLVVVSSASNSGSRGTRADPGLRPTKRNSLCGHSTRTVRGYRTGFEFSAAAFALRLAPAGAGVQAAVLTVLSTMG